VLCGGTTNTEVNTEGEWKGLWFIECSFLHAHLVRAVRGSAESMLNYTMHASPVVSLYAVCINHAGLSSKRDAAFHSFPLSNPPKRHASATFLFDSMQCGLVIIHKIKSHSNLHSLST
jgi:hypothetical protein